MVDSLICSPQFTGYDVGNSLVHASGTITTLFPADGGQIKIEKTNFVQGDICTTLFPTVIIFESIFDFIDLQEIEMVKFCLWCYRNSECQVIYT